MEDTVKIDKYTGRMEMCGCIVRRAEHESTYVIFLSSVIHLNKVKV